MGGIGAGFGGGLDSQKIPLLTTSYHISPPQDADGSGSGGGWFSLGNRGGIEISVNPPWVVGSACRGVSGGGPKGGLGLDPKGEPGQGSIRALGLDSTGDDI